MMLPHVGNLPAVEGEQPTRLLVIAEIADSWFVELDEGGPRVAQRYYLLAQQPSHILEGLIRAPVDVAGLRFVPRIDDESVGPYDCCLELLARMFLGELYIVHR